MKCPECKQEMKFKDREVTNLFIKKIYVCLNMKCNIYDLTISWVIGKNEKEAVDKK